MILHRHSKTDLHKITNKMNKNNGREAVAIKRQLATGIVHYFRDQDMIFNHNSLW